MVEYQIAKRNITLSRQTIRNNGNQGVQLLPYTYPSISALVMTFDCEGKYGGGSTEKGESEMIPLILSQFKKYNIQGTFNFVGKTAVQYENIVKLVAAMNNDIWGHGYSHNHLDNQPHSVQENEVQNTITILSEITDKPCKGWRSPYGVFNSSLYSILEKKGVKFGSNWGSSNWGTQPFNPIIGNQVSKVIELPFDDYFFDALVFKKLNLDSDAFIRLYKNKLLATINNTSIFTSLIHPVNLAEAEDRISNFLDFIDYAAKQENLWITSASKLLSLYSTLGEIDYHHYSILRKRNKVKIELELRKSPQYKAFKSNSQIISLLYRSKPINDIMNSSTDYVVFHLSNFEDVLCIPIDLSKETNSVDIELVL